MRVRVLIAGWLILSMAFLAGYVLHAVLTHYARIMLDERDVE